MRRSASGSGRRDAGPRLTIVDLARKTGAGRTTIIRAERGEHLVRAGTLQRLAEACGVTTDWILTGQTPEQEG